MKILLVGHACSPLRGSEPGATWNWAWQLSLRHQVWAVVHPQYRDEVSEYLLQHRNPNLHVVWLNLDSRFDPFNPRRGQRGVRLHYVWWLKRAYEAGQRLHAEIGFDVCHHVSLGTVGAPPPLWRLPIPFVWGPIGGGQVAPSAFRSYFGSKWLVECIRTARVRWLPYMPAVQKAARRAAVVLATNRETAAVLRSAGAKRIEMFGDTGVPELPEAPAERSSETMTIFWAGRCERIKALPLLLGALAKSSSQVRAVVAGDGPQRAGWEAVAQVLGLGDRVKFLGEVPHAEMAALFRASDVFAFTSLRDSFGSVVLEAMAFGLPVLALDHNGVGTLLPDAAACKVPVDKPETTVAGLAQYIDILHRSPEHRRRMSMAARAFAASQLWENRAARMDAIYQTVVHENSAVRL